MSGARELDACAIYAASAPEAPARLSTRPSVGRNLVLGNNQAGLFGTPQPPAPIAGLDGASNLSAGKVHGCAVIGSEVNCWGNNDCHQLGGDGDFFAEPVVVVSSRSEEGS